MNKKYELVDTEYISFETGNKLYRIKALRDIDRYGVKAGDLGGFVESESNLSKKGDCWIKHEAMVCGNARVYGDIIVFCNA